MRSLIIFFCAASVLLMAGCGPDKSPNGFLLTDAPRERILYVATDFGMSYSYDYLRLEQTPLDWDKGDSLMFIRKLGPDKSDLMLISNSKKNLDCFSLMFFGETDAGQQRELKLEFVNRLKSVYGDKVTFYRSGDCTQPTEGGGPSGTNA